MTSEQAKAAFAIAIFSAVEISVGKLFWVQLHRLYGVDPKGTELSFIFRQT